MPVRKLKINTIEKVASIPYEKLRGPKGDMGSPGRDGIDGRPGVDGKDGRDGADGAAGKDGQDGAAGKDGRSVGHEVKGDKLRFQNPDGSWGEWIDIGKIVAKYMPGVIPAVTYTVVDQAEYKVSGSLPPGNHIFGIRYSGEVTIFVPRKLDPRAILTFKDEDGDADTSRIQIVSI